MRTTTDEKIELTPWYLVRHAPVAGDKRGLYEEADMMPDLPPAALIKAMAENLPADALWYVSPLARTRITAEALIEEKGSYGEIHYNTEIGEQNFGTWQGLSHNELWSQIKDLPPHNWSWLAADTLPPGGESFQSVRDRISLFLEGNLNYNPGQPRVLVTHAGVIRAFAGLALGLDANRSASIGINTFSLTQFLHQTGSGLGGPWQLAFMNRTFQGT